jgi:hypothetical protein
MPNPFQQWLYLDSGDGLCELINGNRTAFNMTNAALFAPGFGCITPLDGLKCAVADLDPVFDCGAPEWPGIVFDVPGGTGTPPPWWDGVANSPSSKGIGFMITEWTGLEKNWNQRSKTLRGSSRGGASFGPARSGDRVMAFNIDIMAADECALIYMRDWLEEQISSACSSCDSVSLWVRECCPPLTRPDYGLWRLDDVVLVSEGVEWAAPPIESMSCTIRSATFTISAGDPCKYSCPTLALTPTAIPTPPDLPCDDLDIMLGCVEPRCDSLAGYRLCVPVPPTSIGLTAAIITIDNQTAAPSGDIKILGMSDPNGVGCNPCLVSAFCGQINVGPIPAYSTLVIDGAKRTVTWKNSATAGVLIDGSAFLDQNVARAPQYSQFGCDPSWLMMEPAGLCYWNPGVTFEVSLVTRKSCL